MARSFFNLYDSCKSPEPGQGDRQLADSEPLYPPEELTPQILESMRPRAESIVFLMSLGAYAVLAWQIAFPFFAFRRGWRPCPAAGSCDRRLESVAVEFRG